MGPRLAKSTMVAGAVALLLGNGSVEAAGVNAFPAPRLITFFAADSAKSVP